MNLRIEDEPLGYQPSRGGRISFRLSYRQRGNTGVSETFQLPVQLYGLGPNWSCSWRFFVQNSPAGVSVVRPGTGGIVYQGADVKTSWHDKNSLTELHDGGGGLIGYTLDYPDGAKATFSKHFTLGDGVDYFLITSMADPAGNTITYGYDSDPTVARLTTVTDPDSRVTHLYYENTLLTNQVTRVVDPFNRTNYLAYDSDINSASFGWLTNIIDVRSLPSSFVYDAYYPGAGWITNLTTPYGPTGFRYGGENLPEYAHFRYGNYVNRLIEVTEPNGGMHLFLFRQECTKLKPFSADDFMPTNYASALVPNTTNSPYYSISNTLDNMDQCFRNSFHWGPLQYGHISSTYRTSGDYNDLTLADYKLAHLRHWLRQWDDSSTGGPWLSTSLSLERAPSPDGVTDGQLTWYDYDGKQEITTGATINNLHGTNNLPSLVARVLPDGTTQFTRYVRNPLEFPTQEISTYTRPDGVVDVRTNTFIYAANGIDLVQHIGANHEQVVSNYFNNSLHQPDASYDALSQETLYTYNANRQVTSVKQPSGLTTTNIYFAGGTYPGWLEKTIDLEIKRTNSYTYDNGLVLTHTDERGLTTTHYWDELQRLTGITYPNGSISNIYNKLDLAKAKDKMDHWTYFGYNEIRQRLAETNANNVVTRYGYCDCGSLLTVTNGWNAPAPQVTTFNYDYQGNRTNVVDADGNTTTNWYNSVAQLVQTGDYWGTNGFNYNNQGLLTTNRNAYGVAQSTVYDIEDRALYVTDANGVTVTNTYDDLNRLRTRGYPDGGIEKFGYSARGLTAYTNQLDTNFWLYAYDEGRRKTFETNANNELIRYTNNAAGDLLSLTDGKNQVTRWNYDEFGRVTNKLDQAAVEILRYQYDADDRLTNRWSKAKGNTGYAYDAVGNLTIVNYPLSPDITRQYDWLNRVTNMVDAAGTTKYTYTLAGRLLTEDGPFSSDTVTNVYTGGLRTGLRLQQPTGMWTNLFAYDAAKRLTSVTSPAGTFDYQLAVGVPSRLPIKITLPNTSYITNVYDNVVRLTGTYLKNSGNTTLDSSAYIYDPANQRTNLTRANGNTVKYKYDNIGQLKVADSSFDTEDRGYFYDPGWNLNYRTNNGSTSTFSVGSKNQLTSVPWGNCSYDNNGNLIQVGTVTVTGYEYDDENQLVVVTNKPPLEAPDPTGGWKGEFTYDGLGRLRIRKDYYGADAVPGGWFQTNTTWYVYAGMRVIQERDSGSTPRVSYTRGSDLSGSLEGAGGIGGLLARSHGYLSGNWTNHNVYFADGNGNITYMLNSSQAMVASYRYDPFGNTISKSGTLADANLYRFSSKEIHVNSGMYYYGFRFYDPNLQRWINRDPIEERGGLNLYGFVGNNPINLIDVLGLTSCDELRKELLFLLRRSRSDASALSAMYQNQYHQLGNQFVAKQATGIAAGVAGGGIGSVVGEGIGIATTFEFNSGAYAGSEAAAELGMGVGSIAGDIGGHLGGDAASEAGNESAAAMTERAIKDAEADYQRTQRAIKSKQQEYKDKCCAK